MRTIENNLIKKLPDADWQIISPGRVNLLGEHADYSNGVVLPAAIDRYVTMVIKPRAMTGSSCMQFALMFPLIFY